jgi:hypothetical protein
MSLRYLDHSTAKTKSRIRVRGSSKSSLIVTMKSLKYT